MTFKWIDIFSNLKSMSFLAFFLQMKFYDTSVAVKLNVKKIIKIC